MAAALILLLMVLPLLAVLYDLVFARSGRRPDEPRAAQPAGRRNAHTRT